MISAAAHTFRLLVGAIAIAAVAPAALANDELLALQGNPAFVVMPSITYSGWNYSALDQISIDNVAGLSLAWIWQVGILDQLQAAPLVVGDTMYLVTPKPNYLFALDLSAQGRIKWEFRPDTDPDIARLACCGGQTRGLNYVGGMIIYAALDGQLFAVNVDSGEAVWQAVAADPLAGETTVGNALVVGDLYILGSSGGERGARGKISAFDVVTGAVAWTMYSMGPDDEVGLGPRFRPFYADDRQGSLATWYGDSWQHGGGTVWGFFTFDPDLNLLYYSTGNCGPWNPDYRREWGVVTLDERGGLVDYRNNWCASQMARDAVTGELIWVYNMTPADNWDLDEPAITPLVDIEIGGALRQTAIKAGRNGYFYVWDRASGEMLIEPWPFVYVDFMTGVDMATGRPLYDIAKWNFTDLADRRRYVELDAAQAAVASPAGAYTGTEVSWCPYLAARNWENDAYSPRTGLLYSSTDTVCGSQLVFTGEYRAGEGYTLARSSGPTYFRGLDGEPVDYAGELQANSPASSSTVWSIRWQPGNNAPILATAGDLLFQGRVNQGAMVAYDARDGTELWRFRTGSAYHSSPITYLGPDGRQYLAVVASAPAYNEPVALGDWPTDENRYSRSGTSLQVFVLP